MIAGEAREQALALIRSGQWESAVPLLADVATNLHIDSHLILEAASLGGHKTKKAAVTQALVEYIERLRQSKIVSLFGTVNYDPKHDYKKQRRRR